MAGKLRFDVNFKMLKQDFVPLEQQEDNGESTVRVMELQFPRVEQPVKILQDPREGCGGHLWAAAEHLCEYLGRAPEFAGDALVGKRVLELGAGTGLVGMYMHLRGAHVTLTDLPVILPVLQANVALNVLANAPTIAPLCWGEPCKEFAPVELIVASDCVYLEPCFEPLLKTLLELTDPHTQILMAYQHRRKAENRFWKMLNKHFTSERVRGETVRGAEENKLTSLQLSKECLNPTQQKSKVQLLRIIRKVKPQPQLPQPQQPQQPQSQPQQPQSADIAAEIKCESASIPEPEPCQSIASS